MTDLATKPWYDTHEGIKKLLKEGLAGLHRLSEERHSAGYYRKERMGWWCVLGTFVFDKCGNTMVFTEGGPDYYTFNKSMPSVFSHEEWVDSGDKRMWGTTCGRIPPTDEVCPHCFDGWDLWNLKDHQFTFYDDKKSYHKSCFKLKQTQEELTYFEELFKEAGLQTRAMRLLPNGYSKSTSRPWILAETQFGWLKVGWRKRVISMHWDQFTISVDGLRLFDDQAVTKGAHMIHAWGKEACIDYIKRLMWAARQAETHRPCMSYCGFESRHAGSCRSEERPS